MDSIFYHSSGFEEMDKLIEERKNAQLNRNLTKLELEIYMAIKFGDFAKLKDLGAGE